MGRKKKPVPPLPAGFPAIDSYVRYYREGWHQGYLRSTTDGKTATIERFKGRDVKIPIEDVEIPAVEVVS
jgi:hypothetical protein